MSPRKLAPVEERDRTPRELYWRDPEADTSKLIHAWANMLFVDHGLLRLAFPNRHKLSDTVWRSSQPSPGQIKWFANQGGKTILTLRGFDYRGSMFLEKRACLEHDINLINWQCRSDSIVSVPQIQKLIGILRSVETPLLIHCKSGADRMGFVSVVYRHLIMGDPIEVAMEQLSGRFLHIKTSKTGVLDYFFEVFAKAHKERGIDFETWLETECDPKAINDGFVPNGFAGWFERKILRRE